MKNYQAIRTVALLATCFLTWPLQAQVLDYASHKEKVYLHTNHVYYQPGETVFFTCYLVDAKTQQPSWLSQVVYAEVIDPSGKVLQKLPLKAADGYAEGSWRFDDQAPGGRYKIRAYTNWMRNEAERTWHTREIVLQKLIAPRVLMKLDFPQKGYGAGDEVQASFSMRNLRDQPITGHGGTYTVSIGGRSILVSEFRTDDAGKAVIRFRLPAALDTSDGLLNLTVSYDGYTESIARRIPIVLHRIDLQFLPEGGKMLVGVPAVVAFRAVDEQGKGADVQGHIVDREGHTVARFAALHRGMGKFTFTPQKDQSYRAVVTAPAGIVQPVPLPQADRAGAVLNIARSGGQVKLSIRTIAQQDILVTALSRGQQYFARQLVVQGREELVLPENLFPAGIVQFNLSAGGLPLAERLVFMHEDERLRISLSTGKKQYLPREQVVMHIRTTDKTGKPLPANLSLAVIDDKLWSLADDKQDNILSWLLLSSELQGGIEEPSFYFDEKEPQAAAALDLVMLTHGYRYFDYIPPVAQARKLQYLYEDGNVISGTIVDQQGSPLPSEVYLLNRTGKQQMTVCHTGPDGAFYFSQLTAGADYYLLARALQGRRQPVIRVAKHGSGYNLAQSRPVSLSLQDSAWLPAALELGDGMIEKAAVHPAAPATVHDNELNGLPEGPGLSEVVVVGYGVLRRDQTAQASVRVDEKELSWAHVNSIQGKVAGLQAVPRTTPGQDANFVIRGYRSLTGSQYPLIIVDGLPVQEYNLQSFDASDISSITILKDAAAIALYGAQAANGVIVIESKKRWVDRYRINVGPAFGYSQVTVKVDGPGGGQVVKRFYAPRYSGTDTGTRSDFRETIYWNGVVQTDRQGEATVSFYNSDASTTFRAIAEGIGYDGKAGRGEATYAVAEPLGIDIKIPPYLTIGDTALLPLVIKNNSDRPWPVRIAAQLPKGLQGGAFDEALELGAGRSAQVLIPVTAIGPLRDEIKIAVSANGYNRTLQLPIEASQKGFPVYQVFSGARTATHRFDIRDAVPGSVRATVKVFKALDEQLLDGIGSMLRQPTGCFEQTSSVLYPNIFVLKYLKSKNLSAPELEARAMEYIHNGYKRLLTFETKEGGFEWFGHTPAHLALTAYGLMELTDLKAFVQVDEALLRRTTAFLLSRRDGQGGFNHAKGAYGRYASMSPVIADCYIVYALSQAGIGMEIMREYKRAVAKALETKDGYLVPLMALAASNMQQQDDFERLLTLANQLYDSTGLQAKTSMVESYGQSLRLEVLSLYALALMRSSNDHQQYLHAILTEVLAQRSYYGYGSTQATVLALQAVMEYGRLREAVGSTVRLAINGVPAAPGDATALLRAGANEFEAVYHKDSGLIPYYLEVGYHTFKPADSEAAPLHLGTSLSAGKVTVGQTVRMEIEVTNKMPYGQGMAIARIGIPAGLSVQPWQLKELMEQQQVAYYELFDNWLVFYWTSMEADGVKKIGLDLKAEIPGRYRARASSVNLYYMPERQHWNDGIVVSVDP